MTATNINIDEFIQILVNIKNSGCKFVDLDMLPDENHTSMNKLVIHPVRSKTKEQGEEPISQPENRIIIRNPNIRTDNNDIFDSFKDLL